MYVEHSRNTLIIFSYFSEAEGCFPTKLITLHFIILRRIRSMPLAIVPMSALLSTLLKIQHCACSVRYQHLAKAAFTDKTKCLQLAIQGRGGSCDTLCMLIHSTLQRKFFETFHHQRIEFRCTFVQEFSDVRSLR